MVDEKKVKVEEVVKAPTKELAQAKIVAVPATYDEVIELEDGIHTDQAGLLVKIYNKLTKIEKSVVG